MWTWTLPHEATHMSTVRQVVGGSKIKFWMQNKTDSPGSGDSETKLWLKPSWLKPKGQNVEDDSQKNVATAPAKQRSGEVGHMERKYSDCNEGNSLDCIKLTLSGRERRASHPHRLPFLLSWWGKQDVFHPARLRDQSERRLRWNWPQFAPLHVSHLSNIYNTIVLFTSPPPPPAEQRLPFLHGTLPRPLNRLSPSSSPLLHNLWPLHGRYHIL